MTTTHTHRCIAHLRHHAPATSPIGLVLRSHVPDPDPDDPTEALEALTAIRSLSDMLEHLADDAAFCARLAGASWQQIGDALAMSRQGAWERWGPIEDLVAMTDLPSNDPLAEPPPDT